MCDTNLEASQVVLSSTVLSLRVAVLAVEKDGDKRQKFWLFWPPKGHCSVGSLHVSVAATICYALIGQWKLSASLGLACLHRANWPSKNSKSKIWLHFRFSLSRQRMQLRSSAPGGMRHLAWATCIHAAWARCRLLCMRGWARSKSRWPWATKGQTDHEV